MMLAFNLVPAYIRLPFDEIPFVVARDEAQPQRGSRTASGIAASDALFIVYSLIFVLL